MLSNLPWDLIEEILSRVPATSLKRLRSTCKAWNALFKDGGFTETHFRQAAKESLVLMFKDFRVHSMSVNLNVPDPSVEFRSELGLKDPQPVIVEVSHCDGLLLCTTMDNRIVVWNPCSGETRWVQLKTDDLGFDKFALGYSNNKTYRSYKILWYLDTVEPNHHVAGFEVYDFNSNSWKVDEVALDGFIISHSVSLKGNTYWLASDYEINRSLLCFDFTTEKYKHFGLPKFQDIGYLALSVVREEQLSLVHQSLVTQKMEIWVTTKIDTDTEAVLWSKSFTVVSHIRSDYYPDPECFLIDEENKMVLCCNVSGQIGGSLLYIIGEDEKYYKIIPYVDEASNDSWRRPFVFNYIPSLVQIEETRGQKQMN